MFEDFRNLIINDLRSLSPRVYQELGAVIWSLCSTNVDHPLNTEARWLAVTMLMAEFNNAYSSVYSYEKLLDIFRVVRVCECLPSARYEQMIFNFLNVAALDLPDDGRKDLEEAAARRFGEPEESENALVVATMLNWLGTQLGAATINARARRQAGELLGTTVAFMANAIRIENAGGRVVDGGPLRTRQELFTLTEVISGWAMLCHDDGAKANLHNMLSLVEFVANPEDDLAHVRAFLGRADIFVGPRLLG